MNEWIGFIVGFLVVFERIGVGSTHSNTFVVDIDIPAKFVVVDFIQSSLVSVSLKNQVQRIFRREQIELIQNSQELILRNIALIRLVEIFEMWLNQHSLVLNFFIVQVQQLT